MLVKSDRMIPVLSLEWDGVVLAERRVPSVAIVKLALESRAHSTGVPVLQQDRPILT